MNKQAYYIYKQAIFGINGRTIGNWFKRIPGFAGRTATNQLGNVATGSAGSSLVDTADAIHGGSEVANGIMEKTKILTPKYMPIAKNILHYGGNAVGVAGGGLQAYNGIQDFRNAQTLDQKEDAAAEVAAGTALAGGSAASLIGGAASAAAPAGLVAATGVGAYEATRAANNAWGKPVTNEAQVDWLNNRANTMKDPRMRWWEYPGMFFKTMGDEVNGIMGGLGHGIQQLGKWGWNYASNFGKNFAQGRTVWDANKAAWNNASQHWQNFDPRAFNKQMQQQGGSWASMVPGLAFFNGAAQGVNQDKRYNQQWNQQQQQQQMQQQQAQARQAQIAEANRQNLWVNRPDYKMGWGQSTAANNNTNSNTGSSSGTGASA